MTKYLRNIAILISPFLFMVLINELIRPGIKENPYSKSGITAINSAIQTKDKCSWNCHNNTTYCMENHVKLMKPYFKYLDPIYFGMIRLLFATGNYGLANIILLVVLWPLLMFLLLMKSLQIQQKINTLKK